MQYIPIVRAGEPERMAALPLSVSPDNGFDMCDPADYPRHIHNAGVGYREARRIETEDGFPHVFAINVLAPYILTALIERPERLVYLSSGMHYGAGPHLEDLLWTKRPWRGSEAYAESKLHDVLLAFAVASHAGRMSGRMRWNLDGSRPAWAVPVRPAI